VSWKDVAETQKPYRRNFRERGLLRLFAKLHETQSGAAEFT
jgi:hypothetical protein